MLKTTVLPASRLICFGGARRHTQAPPDVGQTEFLPPDQYAGG